MNLKGITMKNILITGGAGLVGTVLTQGLKDKYNVKILDIKTVSYTHLTLPTKRIV